ncbi:MAG: LamG domain-containing protein, partial [Planctomycetota bacterium]
SLNLPIKQAPIPTWDDPADWAIVDPEAQDDDGAAIQAAIDSGAKTVVLQQGFYVVNDTIVLRGNLERLYGNWAMLMPGLEFGWSDQPVIQLVDVEGGADAVVVEAFDTGFLYRPGNWWFQHDADDRALIIRDVIFGYGGGAYRNSGTGDLFIEDICHGGGGQMRKSPAFVVQNQNVWARHWNTEAFEPHLIADNADVWIMGCKFGEYYGPYFVARNGARVELIGGVTNSLVKEKRHPEDRSTIIVDHAEVSLSYVERATDKQGAPHPVIATEFRDGETARLMLADVPRRGTLQDPVKGGNIRLNGANVPLVRAGLPRPDDQPVLSLATSATTFDQAGDVPTITLHIDAPADADLTAAVQWDWNGTASTLQTVTIPAGETSVNVELDESAATPITGRGRSVATLASGSAYIVDFDQRAITLDVIGSESDLQAGLEKHLPLDKTTDPQRGQVAAFTGTGMKLADGVEVPKQGDFRGPHYDLQVVPEAAVFMHDRFFERTVSMWVKPDATDTPQMLFDQGGGRYGMALAIVDGELRAGFQVIGKRFELATPLPADQWSHVALVFHHGAMELYVDGKLADTSDIGIGWEAFTHIDYTGDAGGLGATFGTSSIEAIGNKAAPFVGQMDEVRIYERSLTPTEVGTLAEK